MSDTPAMIEAAETYVKKWKWAIFPLHWIKGKQCSCGRKCGSPGKHPLVRYGCKAASSDLKQIRLWWRQWPRANIGIATGEINKLVAIDVDPKHGGRLSLSILERDNGPLPDTPISLTGGGGEHYIFDWPGFSISNRANLEPGLDVRGDGGYIVAPPSNHASGHYYTWELAYHPTEMRPAAMPAWFIKLIQEPRKAEIVGEGADEIDALQTMVERGVTEGERNDSATRLAGRYLGMGLSGPETRHLLMGWNRLNRPPMDEDEIDKVIQSVARRELLKGGEKPGEDDDRGTVLAALNEKFKIRIDDIQRVEGDEPFYRFIANGRVVEIAAQDVESQSQWRKAMVAVTEKVPTRIGTKARVSWDHYLQMMLNIAESIDPGEEATEKGLLKAWMKGYFETRKPYKEQEPSVRASDPREVRGQVYVSIADMRQFLLADKIRIGPQKVAQMFATHGFKRKVMHIELKIEKKQTTAAMWSVPVFIWNGKE